MLIALPAVADSDRDGLQAVQVQAQAVVDGLQLVEGALVVLVLDEEDEALGGPAAADAGQAGLAQVDLGGGVVALVTSGALHRSTP